MGITADTTVSGPELAAVLGLTGRRVAQLAEDGVLTKISRGRFNLAASVQAYVDYKATAPLPDGEDMETIRLKAKAESRLKSAKADVAELEAAELRGKMHRSEDVAAMTEDLIYAIRSALIALPGRLAVDVADCSTPSEASEVIRREVYQVMRELARYRYDAEKYEQRVRDRLNWATEGAGPLDGEE